jgi:hypothetical protein
MTSLLTKNSVLALISIKVSITEFSSSPMEKVLLSTNFEIEFLSTSTYRISVVEMVRKYKLEICSWGFDDVRTKIFLHLFTSNLETENFETDSLSLTGVNETANISILNFSIITISIISLLKHKYYKKISKIMMIFLFKSEVRN